LKRKRRQRIDLPLADDQQRADKGQRKAANQTHSCRFLTWRALHQSLMTSTQSWKLARVNLTSSARLIWAPCRRKYENKADACGAGDHHSNSRGRVAGQARRSLAGQTSESAIGRSVQRQNTSAGSGTTSRAARHHVIAAR
jgi:hypothetical protein